MNIVIKILQFSGALWLAILFGKTVGQIRGSSTVIGISDSTATFDWFGLILNVMIGVTLLGIAAWLARRTRQS